MTVRKFRSIEEMKRAPRREADSSDLPRVLEALWELGMRTRRAPLPPRGVHKHRSIEAAKALKEKWSASG
jgi:hypothetical protein